MGHKPLWTLEDVAALYGAALSASDKSKTITSVNLDSRYLDPGSLFFAYNRENGKDGHDFLPDVRDKGATAAIIEQDATCDGLPLIRVANSNTALQKLGQVARDRVRDDCKIVALTGSVGKTTSRALTQQALSVFGSVHASADSLNNHWGVPLTLARMPADTDYGVFEVGMNHSGEIGPLTAQIRPHIAIITTIEAAHIGNFADGIIGIAKAKAEIFSGLLPGGTAVLNIDNPQYSLLRDEAHTQNVKNIITFGKHSDADLRWVSYDREDQGGQVTASVRDGTPFTFYLPLRGEHHAMNALAALGAVLALGLDVEHAAQSFAAMTDVVGRGNQSTVSLAQGGSLTLIDDRHNSSPVALNASIRELGHMRVPGRRILALGDMLELGDTSADLHAGIAPVIRATPIDLVLTCGPMMAHLAQALPAAQVTHFPDSQAMAQAISQLVKNNDTILIKGSRGAQMVHVVDALNRMGQST